MAGQRCQLLEKLPLPRSEIVRNLYFNPGQQVAAGFTARGGHTAFMDAKHLAVLGTGRDP